MEAVREAILYRTVHRLYRRDRFLLVESSLPGDDGGSSVPGVEIRPLEDSDWDPLGQLMTTRKIERFRNRSERGRTCFVAWRGGRPIGYSWVSERVDPEIEHYPLPLPSDCVYGWDLYVNRDERGGGVGSALARARLRHARERGFARAWRLLEASNAPALRTIQKSSLGVRVLGEVTFVKLLGRVRARDGPREA